GRHINNIANWCKVLLLLAAVMWGFGFVAMKDAVEVIPPSWLLGIRFIATGLILVVVFHKKMRTFFNREHLIYGSLLGIMLFAAFWVQTIGLIYTTPGKNAFLTACYVVLVPFIYWVVIQKRPTKYNIIAALVCVAGMALVSLQESLTFGFGEVVTIGSALLFGVHIVFVFRWAQDCDVIVLSVYQFFAAGVCGIVAGALFETLPPLSVMLTPSLLLNMAYLTVFASCLALLFQNFSLKYVPPSQASLFLSMEAVFGVLFSVLLYGEVLTLRLVTGFCLIFLAIVISETFPLKKGWMRWQKDRLE
ncbi:MAG: DMT family transporter, partial [Coriobacteriaceae bacterium]|nr:DMT family transporter [Coriobacteriaceae bacterium]